MDRDLRAIEPGTNVYSSDDEAVGDVEEVGTNYLLVRKGLFFVKERYIPFDAVSRVAADGVYLNVAKEQLDAMTWDEPPVETTIRQTAGTTLDTDVTVAAVDRSETVTERDEVDATIPVVEEELHIGKREVEGGGVRVTTHMEEVPVSEQVTLRDETVAVDRRVVDRPVTDADLAAMTNETIEVHETDEEAVVAKQARVVEEVVVRKDVGERTETVQDTVRRTQVDVEQLSGQTTTSDSVVTTGATLDVDTTSSTTDEGAIERGASGLGNAVERATGADIDRDGDVGRRDPRDNI